MTLLLLLLGLLAVLDLAALVRWVRADSDGRAPLPPYEPFGGRPFGSQAFGGTTR